MKVLDFGLAKATDPASHDSSAEGVSPANSPTFASPAMTQMGVILGTAAYMAPEQAKGKVVDKRADIWAFGCVLYEMLAGRCAFDAETSSEIIAAVLRSEPDLTSLPADLPPPIRRLIQRCLEKDPDARFQSAAELRSALLACAGGTWTQAAARAWWESERAPLKARRERAQVPAHITVARASLPTTR